MGAKPDSKVLEYEPFAIALLVISIGAAGIIYGLGVLPFDFYNIFTWIFCPLGAYTVAYASIVRRDSIYHLVWGLVMITIGAVSAIYNMVNPIVVFGILFVTIAIIGITTYWRTRR